MRIVLQRVTDKRFLAWDGHWTDAIEQAQTFESTERAIHHAFRNHLHQVRVMVNWAHAHYSIELPLSALPHRQPHGVYENWE